MYRSPSASRAARANVRAEFDPFEKPRGPPPLEKLQAPPDGVRAGMDDPEQEEIVLGSPDPAAHSILM